MNPFKKSVWFFTMIALFSCGKTVVPDKNLLVCGCIDPINELEWLNAKFKQLHGGVDINGIVLFSYQDEEVIEVQSSVFSSTNQHQYHCDGTKLDLDNPETFEQYRKERMQVKVLYGTNIWKEWH